MVRTVPDPILGELTIPGFPLKYSAFPDMLDLRAPLLGEHNVEVLGEYLGYTAEQVDDLRKKGILFTENK